jgi:hypothetical protein
MSGADQRAARFAGGCAAQYYLRHGAAFADRAAGYTVDGGPGFGRLPGVTDDQDRRYFAGTIRPGAGGPSFIMRLGRRMI